MGGWLCRGREEMAGFWFRGGGGGYTGGVDSDALEGGLSERILRYVAAAVLAGAGAAWGQDKAAVAKPDVHLTLEQQKVLLADVSATLKFVGEDTKLDVKHPVKGVFQTRESVARELRKKMDEDEGAKRMERSELVLKKFGLLDRDFHMRPFLLSLLTEQIAGFYDNKTGVMNLLDWVPEEEQLPVMAHELTHALQDQRVNLTVWGDQEVKGIAKDVGEDNRHIQNDETDTAREAVLEGQAMVSFADYALKGTGKTLKDVPEMGERLASGAGDMSGSPVMSRAPLLLQQSLLFPYVEGLVFEETVLLKRGVEQAFAGTLDRPPSASSEILHPAEYLAHKVVPVMRLPDIHPLLNAAGYAPYDLGVMGEVDVRMTTELFGGRALAEAVAPAWAGGIYYAAQRKSATAPEKETTASLGLMYSSRWKNDDSARSFFTAYENGLGRKYNHLTRRKADEANETEHVYSTNEGDVLMTLDGEKVFVSEGFDVALARKLRDAVDAVQGVGPVKEALVEVPRGELSGRLIGWMGAQGMMKAAFLSRE